MFDDFLLLDLSTTSSNPSFGGTVVGQVGECLCLVWAPRGGEFLYGGKSPFGVLDDERSWFVLKKHDVAWLLIRKTVLVKNIEKERENVEKLVGFQREWTLI